MRNSRWRLRKRLWRFWNSSRQLRQSETNDPRKCHVKLLYGIEHCPSFDVAQAGLARLSQLESFVRMQTEVDDIQP